MLYEGLLIVFKIFHKRGPESRQPYYRFTESRGKRHEEIREKLRAVVNKFLNIPGTLYEVISGPRKSTDTLGINTQLDRCSPRGCLLHSEGFIFNFT